MKIKELRISRNLRIQDVSDFLNCSISAYSRYENSYRGLPIDILLGLSKLYHVSVDYLLENEEATDTSITEDEASMLRAMRRADERARRDALALLESHIEEE